MNVVVVLKRSSVSTVSRIFQNDSRRREGLERSESAGNTRCTE